MAVLDRETFKKVEWYFYNYFNIRREVKEYRENVLYSGRQLIEGGGNGVSRHSDPTALKALKLVGNKEIANYEKWLQVIEKTVQRYNGSLKGKLIQMRYFDEYAEQYICRKLSIDRATYYNWRAEIVLYAAMLAVQYGLIKVDKFA